MSYYLPGLPPPWEAREVGAALAGAERKKFRDHGAQCKAVGMRFVPLAFHTISGASATSHKEIKSIAGAMARSNREDPSQIIAFTFQKVAMAIQKGNAACLAARMPTVDQGTDGIQDLDY